MKKRGIFPEFAEFLSEDENYLEALEIVKENSSGNIWLFGSTVYKNLAHMIYGFPNSRENKDYDFLVELGRTKPNLRDGWTAERSYFNSVKLIGKTEIDIVPLNNIYWIKDKNKVSIGDFLSGAPLNIFSLVYDTKHKKLIGENGFDSLKHRELRVNNPEHLKAMTKRYNITRGELIQLKAEEIGFVLIE